MTDEPMDASLVAASRAGDREAFGRLVARHQAAARAWCALRLADQEAVLDLVQDAFITAWQRLDTLADPAAFRPWLLGICRFKLVAHRRAKWQRDVQVGLDLDREVDEAMDQEAPEPEAMLALIGCLDQLTADQRHLVRDRFVRQTPFAVLAEHSGKTVNSLTVRLHRILKRLRGCMESHRGVGHA